MSFFGRTPTVNANGVNSEKIELAITELDTITDFFNRMVSSCHNKCIAARYAEPDLNKGESICIDRCVAKFTDVQKKVGEKLQSQSTANKSSIPGSFGST